MDSEPSLPSEKVDSAYEIIWHRTSKDDLECIEPVIAEKIVLAVDHRLSTLPELVGSPLKGARHQLWKIRFSKYRVLYTIYPETHVVLVLSVRHRDAIYTDAHVQDLVAWAILLRAKYGAGPA